MCLKSVRVDYQPEGGSLMMYPVDNATTTSATLSNLPCNEYSISVYAEGVHGGNGRRSDIRVVCLSSRGNYIADVKHSNSILYLYPPLYPSSLSHSH